MNEKKNILIFCDAFLPPAFLPRVRYFCDYFQKKGWKITLITENHRKQKFLPENIFLQLIDYYYFNKKILFEIEWFLKTVLNLIFDHKGNFFYKKSKKIIKKNKFDMIFCSCTFHSFPLTTAFMAAKKLKLPFFVDLRDIFEQAPSGSNHIFAHKIPTFIGTFFTKHYEKINLKRRNKILPLTTAIISVSKWHSDFVKTFNSNSYVIYNGFDENLFLPQNIKSEKFFISYFGGIYGENLRNPKVLFSAVKNLAEKHWISTNNFVIRWFIDDVSKKIIKKFANKYDVENYVSYEKFVVNEKYVQELNRSSILLVLCNSDDKKNYFGIMTTKFFEYIGCNRPILCTPDNNDELAHTINATGCGLASSDAAEVENFIMEKYAEWQQNGFTQDTVSTENRENFSRKNGAEFLEKIISDLAESL